VCKSSLWGSIAYFSWDYYLDASIAIAALQNGPWRPPFVKSIPVGKTRNGMQFSCAVPNTRNATGTKEVWVCNTDEYAGEVWLTSVCFILLTSSKALTRFKKRTARRCWRSTKLLYKICTKWKLEMGVYMAYCWKLCCSLGYLMVLYVTKGGPSPSVNFISFPESDVCLQLRLTLHDYCIGSCRRIFFMLLFLAPSGEEHVLD